MLEGTGVLLGAQDVFWEDTGAFTGEISPSMLAGWCDLALVGHSERRHLFGERDDEVGRKFVAALAHGLARDPRGGGDRAMSATPAAPSTSSIASSTRSSPTLETAAVTSTPG